MKKCVACQSEQLKQVDIITRGEEFRLIENGKFTITPQTQKIIKVCMFKLWIHKPLCRGLFLLK